MSVVLQHFIQRLFHPARRLAFSILIAEREAPRNVHILDSFTLESILSFRVRVASSAAKPATA